MAVFYRKLAPTSAEFVIPAEWGILFAALRRCCTFNRVNSLATVVIILAAVGLEGCSSGSPPEEGAPSGSAASRHDSPVEDTEGSASKAASAQPSQPSAVRSSPCDAVQGSLARPLELALDQPSPGALRATLCNTSTRAQRVLINPMRQPVVLELVHPEQGAMEADDERSVRSGSGTIQASMFKMIEPRGDLQLALGELSVAPNHRGLFAFGTLRFAALPPGSYRARAHMRLRNPRIQERDRFKDVWTGELFSEPVQLEVPNTAPLAP